MYLGYSVLEFTAKYSVESSPEEERTKLISEVAVKCLRFMRRIDVVFQILIYVMVSVTFISVRLKLLLYAKGIVLSVKQACTIFPVCFQIKSNCCTCNIGVT